MIYYSGSYSSRNLGSAAPSFPTLARTILMQLETGTPRSLAVLFLFLSSGASLFPIQCPPAPAYFPSTQLNWPNNFFIFLAEWGAIQFGWVWSSITIGEVWGACLILGCGWWHCVISARSLGAHPAHAEYQKCDVFSFRSGLGFRVWADR